MTDRRFGRYDEVDAAEVASQTRLVRMLDAQNRYPSNINIKEEMHRLLDVQPGDRVLDVGSGTGDDTRRLAELAGPSSETIGIDSSSVMVQEATRRAAEEDAPARFQVGDALDLEFEDDSFDRVWSERLFIWLEDPYTAFREIVRVTRPGGRIVLSTYDTDSGIRGGFEPELNAKLLRTVPDRMPSPGVGRLLPAWCLQDGLVDIVVRPQLVEHEIQGPDSPIYMITQAQIGRAVEAEIFSEEEATAFRREMDRAIERGSFYTVLIAFVVAATKPPG